MRRNVVLLTLLSCLLCSIAPAESKNVPTEKDDYGLTPLHHGVVKGDVELVKSLLEKGAEVDSRDNAGRTALHYAAGAFHGPKLSTDKLSVDGIGILLDKGADVNAQDNIGWTPLHYAAWIFNNDLVNYLIQRGADRCVADKRGHTAYSWMRAKSVYFQRATRLDPTPDNQKYIRKFNEILSILRQRHDYYVARSGKDTNSGTLDSPFRTIYTAIETAEPGDTIFIRGGTYHCKNTIHLDKSGKREEPISIKPFTGERPTLDFSEAKGDSILITGAHWHVKGLVITNGFRGAVGIDTDKAHHNTLEQIEVFGNRYAGIRIEAGAAYNVVLNCDSYRNFDPDWNGEDSDGFGAYWNVGRGNVLIGNRTWNNSDDGYDLWRAKNIVRLERCYAWRNGENIWNHPFFSGNGNGFKLGTGAGRHILMNCISWSNQTSGFDSNGNSEGLILRNCTGWNNKFSNYCFKWGGSTPWEKMILRNNISYGSTDSINPRVDNQSNSWNLNLVLTDSDFLSLDDSVMTAPRNPDGSIPDNDFLKLSPTSKAIDKGVDVNMPYEGKAPDLGAFEYRPTSKQPYIKMLHQYVRDHDMPKIKELLEKGEGVNAKDWLGYAPLHWAMYFGYSDIAEMLISNGASPNLISDTGRTPLEIARAMDYVDLVALLKKHGAKE